MAIEKPAPWTGASGNEYLFYVFDLEPDVPKRPGNYIYAKRNAEGAWVPVYMGHGDVSSRCTDPHVRRCIASKAATHIHLRLNGSEVDREAELQDLLAHYANAYAPEGCHAGVKATRLHRQNTKAATSKTTTAGKAPERKAPAKTTAPKKAAAKKAAPKKAPAQKPTVKTTKPKTPRPRSR